MHQPAFICSHHCRSTQKESGEYVPHELWVICHATTAAPTFFAPMKIYCRTLVDGDCGRTNNPTRETHFRFLSEVAGYKDRPVIWFNIGTGSPSPTNSNNVYTKRSSVARLKRIWRDRLVPKAFLEAQNLVRDL